MAGNNRPLTWDNTGERYFETGVDRGVLFVLRSGRYSTGVPWNGLTAVNESASGAESNPVYADNMKYLNLISAEEYKATIEAYSYPDEFKPCIGETEIKRGLFAGQQKRNHFGFSFRSKHGDDVEGADKDYKIHLIFDCIASPSERSYATVNESPEAMQYSWEVSTSPINIDGGKPSANLVLESKRFRSAGLMNVLKRIENIIYGTATTDPTFPTMANIMDAYDLEMYLRDSTNDELLDSTGAKLISRVFD